MVAPQKYRQLTKRCRKPVKELTGDSGRGPVADQLRAILADQGFKSSPEDLFKVWDKNGGGSVSRKEFRSWWPSIGYNAPMEDLNDLFDEFDVDGSGEIDTEEFTTAFKQKGKMWQELAQLQKNNDESEAIHLAIVQIKAKIARQEKARIIAEAAARRLEEKIALRQPTITEIEKDIVELTKKLEQSQKRLDALQGGLKAAMQKSKVVNAFKSTLTPDEAATAIQSRMRVKAAQKAVKEKRATAAPPATRVNYTMRKKPKSSGVDAWYAKRKSSGIGANIGSSLGLTARVGGAPGFAQVLPHAHQLHDEVAALRRQLAKQEEGLRRMSHKHSSL